MTQLGVIWKVFMVEAALASRQGAKSTEESKRVRFFLARWGSMAPRGSLFGLLQLGRSTVDAMLVVAFLWKRTLQCSGAGRGSVMVLQDKSSCAV